jgi:O-antigen/teichoic acid export membrane protein
VRDRVRTLLSAIRAGTLDRKVLGNLIWNAAGAMIPLLAGILSIPILINVLGTTKFGVLSLAWIIVGYFSLFDLGLGRALTHVISQKLATGAEADVPNIARSGVLLLCGLGLLGGLIVALIAPWLVSTQIKVPPDLQSETLVSLYLLGASIPVVILAAGLRGILEAYERFDIVNLIRTPLGVLNYLAPLAALQISQSLPVLVFTLVVIRVLTCVMLFYFCRRQVPNLLSPLSIDLSAVYHLLGFGGWMTVSNVAGPLLLYAGRFLLAVLVSAEAVSYFAVPYDALINLLLIPGLFVTTLFPVFSGYFGRDLAKAAAAYRRYALYILLVMAPLCGLAIVFAKPGLAIWIGPDFAEKSYVVAQILAAGIFINSVGHLAQAVLQASGRPDITAKLHIAELVLYLPYLVWLVITFDVEGAAIAWLVRVTLSTIALALLVRWRFRSLQKQLPG